MFNLKMWLDLGLINLITKYVNFKIIVCLFPKIGSLKSNAESCSETEVNANKPTLTLTLTLFWKCVLARNFGSLETMQQKLEQIIYH